MAHLWIIPCAGQSYDEVIDAGKCVNLMLAAPDFGGAAPEGGYEPSIAQPYLTHLAQRGCSDFMFVPGTGDCHLFVMRTEESLEGVISTWSSVIDLEGNVLMAEAKIAEDRKFEGCCWVGGWGGFEGDAAAPSAPGCVIA